MKVTEPANNSATGSTMVTVNNVVPGSISVTPSSTSVPENASVSLSGSFTDPGTLDTHTLSINWGDGGMSMASLGAGVTTFGGQAGLTHQYLDGPNSYTITMTVTDKDSGAAASDPIGITVTNVAPANVSISVPGSVNEQQSFSLDFSFTDPGTLDTHTVSIDWGDSSPATTDSLGAGVLTGLGYTHTYADDNPTNTASDSYTITVTITDKDGATGSGTQSITVNDLAPVVTITGGLNTITQQYSDPSPIREVVATDNPQDTVAASTKWGPAAGSLTAGLPPGMSLTLAQPTTAGVTKWSLTGGGTTLAPGTYTIRVCVKDDDTLSGFVDFTLTVNPEDARVQYTGPTTVSALASSTSVVVPLKATVEDITAVPSDPAYDPFAGNIGNATVTFVDRLTGTVLTPAIPVTPSPTDSTTGTVTYNLTIPLGTTPNLTLELQTIVGGYYTRNDASDDVFINVQKPTNPADVEAAAGSYVSTSSSGAFPAKDNTTVYFGIGVSNTGGSAYALYQKSNGATTSTFLIYIPSLSTVTVASNATTSHLVGAATIYDLSSGSPVAVGSGTGTIDTVDHKGSGADTLAISVVDGGTLLFSSRFSGGTTIQTPVKSPGRINIYKR